MPESADVSALADALREIRDEQAAIATVYRWTTAFYAIELEAWLDCFVADGAFTIHQPGAAQPATRLNGHDEMRAWFLAHAERVPFGKANQLVTQPLVTVDGDRATVQSRFVVIHRIVDAPTLLSTGRYHDELVRCPDGAWRITDRTAHGEMRRG